jgi:hypothetical protein
MSELQHYRPETKAFAAMLQQINERGTAMAREMLKRRKIERRVVAGMCLMDRAFLVRYVGRIQPAHWLRDEVDFCINEEIATLTVQLRRAKASIRSGYRGHLFCPALDALAIKDRLVVLRFVRRREAWRVAA